MNKMTLEAKTVIKNKFWIVEDEGQKVATIQAMPGGVVYVAGDQREQFPNIKLLSNRYNIHVEPASKSAKSKSKTYDIYGFPTGSRPYNELYDVRRRLPFFTKNSKSKSFYCAGYYAIKLNDTWSQHFCPKSITVSRYPYLGPFRTKEEVQQAITEKRAQESL